MFLTLFAPNMFIRGDAELNHEQSRLGMKSHMFKPWAGPPRHTKAERDAKMGAIASNTGIDDILKRAMGNRAELFNRT